MFRSEHEFQVALVNDEFPIVFPSLALDLYAIPNGDYRAFTVGMRLKREGVKPGMPDLMLPVASGKYHGAFLELKQPGNKPSESQHECIVRLRGRGYYAAWAESMPDALDFFKTYFYGE